MSLRRYLVKRPFTKEEDEQRLAENRLLPTERLQDLLQEANDRIFARLAEFKKSGLRSRRYKDTHPQEWNLRLDEREKRLIEQVLKERESAVIRSPVPRGGSGRNPKVARNPPNTGTQLETVELTRWAEGSGTKRLSGAVISLIAARRLDAYLESTGTGQTEFANKVGTTDRTLRTFRKTGKVRRDIFDKIAKAMGTTREELLKPE